MRRATGIIATVCAAWAAGACSDSDPSVRDSGGNGSHDTGPGTDGGGPPPGKQLAFVKQSLDLDKAGIYSAIASRGARVGVAYYRTLGQEDWPTVECPATSLGPGGPKARPAHDLYYSESADSGDTWGSPVEIDRTINIPVGVSMVIGPDNTVHVGYLGGEMSRQECASSDAMIASSSDGQSWTTRTVYSGGPIGDTVGYWTSVALDPSGQVRAAYRDVGYGLYEQIGIEKSEVRYDTGGEAIDEDTGGGIYATLRFTAAGEPAIMHFNGVRTDGMGGIQLAIRRGGGWQTQQLVAGGTAERPSFETDGRGKWGLAWPSSGSLAYIESSDLSSWSQRVTVDLTTTHNGEHASLAFDSAGNPAVSYYRCGPAGATSCKLDQDGLMLAYRIDGKWKTHEVDTGKEFACGDRTALTFNDRDEPVIAYRCVMLRNADNQFVDTVKIARGVWK